MKNSLKSDWQQMAADTAHRLHGFHLHQIYAQPSSFLLFRFKKRTDEIQIIVKLNRPCQGIWASNLKLPKPHCEQAFVIQVKKHLKRKSYVGCETTEDHQAFRWLFPNAHIDFDFHRAQGHVRLKIQNHQDFTFGRGIQTQPTDLTWQPILKKLLDTVIVNADNCLLEYSKAVADKSSNQENRREQKKIEKLITRLENDLANARDSQQESGFAEAIASNLHNDNGEKLFGKCQITHPNGKQFRYNFTKPMSAKEAMLQLFELAKKKKRAVPKIASRLAQAREKLSGINAIETQHFTDEQALEKALLSDVKAPIKPKNSGQKRPVYEKTTPKGEVLWIGKNAQGNEWLLKNSKGHDIWLHSKEGPGAHVVVRKKSKNQEISQESIEFAAIEALKYGKGRKDEGYVLVALRQDVKKFKSGKPGQVLIDRGKTIYVRRNSHVS